MIKNMLRLRTKQLEAELFGQLFQVTHLMTWKTSLSTCHRNDKCAAQKTIFPKFWNIVRSPKRLSQYNLSNKILAQKKDGISYLRKVQNKNFSVISKYHL